MVDRVTEYFGALVRETDGLQSQQNTMVGLGWLAQAAIGTIPFGSPGSFVAAVDGFQCIPTGPASLNVILTAGQVYQLENLEATAWSSLPLNTALNIIKQGLMQINDVLTITPPGTAGQSQVYLIEVQYADLDTNPVLLPYWNAAAPTIPFAGPQNTGQSQNTARLGIAAVQIKAGTPATTGSQVNPTVDAGWVGLFYVTVANGQTAITSAGIKTVLTSPWIPTKLPAVPPGVLNGTWIYAVDTGTVNAYASTIWPIPTALVAGMQVRVKIGITNTGASTFNLNGLGAAPIIRGNLSTLSANDLTANAVVDLTFDGTSWQISNYLGIGGSPTNNFFNVTGLPYAVDIGTASALVGPYSPAITGGQFIAGLTVLLNPSNNCPGGTVTFGVNANAAKNVINFDGTPLNSNDWLSGQIIMLIYDGTVFRLINVKAPNAPTKVMEINGNGQVFTAQNVTTLITGFTTVSKNTFLTSSWNGNTFTVGSGEDGLYSVFITMELLSNNTSFPIYNVIAILRTRSSVQQWYWLPGTSIPQPSGDCAIDLQVGDTLQFYYTMQGSYASITEVSEPTSPAPNISIYRIEELH